MRIHIETVPHSLQDYETVGNWKWLFDRGQDSLYITVSDMGNWRYEMLVGLHELIEALLCKHAGVDEAAVTAFDVEFETARESITNNAFEFRDRMVTEPTEPGDQTDAPYHSQHQFASTIERVTASMLKVNWDDYNTAINAL